MKKRPMFRSCIRRADNDGYTYAIGWDDKSACPHFVRVTDARELTAEKAVQRVLQALDDESALMHTSVKLINKLASCAGMTATIKNGKVIVRKARTQ